MKQVRPAKRKAEADRSPSQAKSAKSFCGVWLNQFKWLRYTGDKMFCSICKEINKSNPMASSVTTNFRWSTPERHTESIDHHAIEAKVLCRSMTQATEKAVSEKEKAILSAMRTMYYVIKMNLPVCHYGELVEFLRFQGMLWSWLFCWHWNSFIYFVFIFDVGNSHAWSPSHISFPSKHDAKFILFLLYPSGCEDLDNLSAGSNSTYTSRTTA